MKKLSMLDVFKPIINITHDDIILILNLLNKT